MRVTSLPLVALVLAASTAGAFPLDAVTPRASLTCPVPSARQCRDINYLRTRCGKIQAARSRVDVTSPCNLVLESQASRRQSLPSQVKVVLQPRVMTDALGNVVEPDPPEVTELCSSTRPRSACAEVQPYSSFAMKVTGDANTAFARTWKNIAFLPPSNTSIGGTTGKALLTNSRQQYAENGIRVETCGEYVYEKYFDYTRFEEEAAIVQYDPRGVYDVAFGSAGLPWSIGSRGVLGFPLRQLDGTPFEASIAFPTNQPKNDFYGHPYLHEEPQPGEDPVGIPFYAVPCAGRSRVYLDDTLWIEDLELYTSLVGAETHDESFTWHQQQQDALRAQGYLDEELYELDELKVEFLDILAERRWIQSVVHDYLQYIFLLGTRDEVLQTGIDVDPDAPITNPFENLAFAIAAREVGYDAQKAGQQTGTALPFSSPGFAANVNPDPTVVQAYLNDEIPQALCSDVEPHGFMEIAFIRLAVVDAALEDVLQRAQQSDCLNATGIGPCDWSPALFAQRVTNLFVKEREDDMRVCLEKTKGNIEAIRERNLRLGSNTVDDIFTDAGINCSERLNLSGATVFWDANPTLAEQYFECIDEWIKATVAELIEHQGSPFDADGKLVVGKGFSTGETLGNSKVGASFSIGANFGVRGFDQIESASQAGSLTHSLGGQINASARLFGETATIVDGQMKTTLDEVDVDFEIAGVELYGDSPEQQYEGSLALIIDGDSRTLSFIDSSTTVMVGPIPITVHGSVTGEVGVTYSVMALQSEAILNDELVASYEPYTRVDAFASAAVNAGIASAGVKGTINVVHVALPYRAGTHVHFPPGSSDAAIDVYGDSSLAVRALAGRFAVFAKVGTGVLSKKYEKTIYSWPGLQWNKTLWADDYSVSVEPLLLYQDLGGLPDGSP